jgi:hypothetical protein
MDKMLEKNPNSYFLALAKNGAILPIEFNINILKDPNIIQLGDQSILRKIPKSITNPKTPPLFSQKK